MNEFCLHPNIYATGPSKGLLKILENIWVKELEPGEGTIYIFSGFSNYNGGVRFYDVFKEHSDQGGKIKAFLGASTSQRLSSKEVVKQLLECGAEVNLINRKRLLHAKFYGYKNDEGERLVISSANFTGPGMSQNIEASVFLDTQTTKTIGFSWDELINSVLKQRWDIYQPQLAKPTAPAWNLLFEEIKTEIKLDESEETSLILVLGHADTARITARTGTNEGKGTQYFWLSKDCFDFFPPLTIRNKRGYKTTYSTLINLYYYDLGVLDKECRVTFEAENNFDFRLGTSKLRYTGIANKGDIAIISRVKETDYILRILKSESKEAQKIAPYAINYIGHQGKKYGFIGNEELKRLLNIKLTIPKEAY